MLGLSGQVVPEDYLVHKEHTDLTRDGTASTERLALRLDLPDGKYLVRLVLGRLDRAACSMQVSLIGRIVATDIRARHFAGRGAPDHLFGFPRVIRLPAEVHGAVLRIEIQGDDSAFRVSFLREFNRPPPTSYLVDVPTRSRKPARPELDEWGRDDARVGLLGGGVGVFRDIGFPFTGFRSPWLKYTHTLMRLSSGLTAV